MSFNSYTQQVPYCPPHPAPENITEFVCNSPSLREFPAGFPVRTKTISVEFTQVSSLGVETLQDLPNLQELHLSNNRLETLPSGLFRNLPELHTLDLSTNLLEDLPPEIFTDATNLTLLSLSENRLTLPSGLFRNLPALHFLDLSRNLLEDLPADLFTPVTSLAHLSLSANQLTELRPSWFVTLKELKNLRLDHNQLKEIPPDCLTFLEFLNLINNPIVSITPDTFRGTPMLLVLSLGNNSLTHVPPGLFRSLENLERLDLSANEITSLEAPLVNVSSEFTLDLSGNPWACDCRLQALFNWARESNVDWLSKENVVCAFPKSLRGKTPAWVNFNSQNSLASMGELQLPEFPSQNARTSLPTIPQSATDSCQLPTAALGPSGICSPPIFQAAKLRNTLS
uniref:LRRCT domain-containing protein n=1 Tax=Pseudonaja textilis TaxID=8673 RepID=A0A670ZQD6_PSETE